MMASHFTPLSDDMSRTTRGADDSGPDVMLETKRPAFAVVKLRLKRDLMVVRLLHLSQG